MTSSCSELFNNPMVKSALQSMSERDRENYRKIGQSMYNSVNFQDNTILNNMAVSGEDISLYAIEGLKSGLNPNSLTPLEVSALKDKYGLEWYKKFGYELDDVKDIENISR